MQVNKELMKYLRRFQKAEKELFIMDYKRKEDIPLSFKEEVNYHEINGYVSGMKGLWEIYTQKGMDKDQLLEKLPTLKKRLDYLEDLDMGNMGMTSKEVKQGLSSLYSKFQRAYEANEDFFEEEKIDFEIEGENKEYSLHPKISSYFSNTLIGNILKWTNSNGSVKISFEEKEGNLELNLTNSTRISPRENIHGEGKGIGTDFIHYFLNAINGSWQQGPLKEAKEDSPGIYKTKVSIPLEEIALE